VTKTLSLDKKLSELKEDPSDSLIEIDAFKSCEKSLETTLFQEESVQKEEDPKIIKKEIVKRKIKSSLSESSSRGRSRQRNRSQQEGFNKTNLETNNNRINTSQKMVVQTFTFMNWEINIDTLVRLFIIA
jgi:hypothetical protein